jgi:hypothetical protein
MPARKCSTVHRRAPSVRFIIAWMGAPDRLWSGFQHVHSHYYCFEHFIYMKEE